jgi:hypothetical protein
MIAIINTNRTGGPWRTAGDMMILIFEERNSGKPSES